MASSLESSVALVFVGIIPLVVFLYAAYWSFVIRSAIVSRIYRNHALALGTTSAIIAITLIPASVPVIGPLVNVVANDLVILIFVAFFAFVDSSISVARRSDPLLRPLLSWERFRLGIWVLFLALVASWILTDNGGFPPQGFVVFLIPVVIGVPSLLIGSRRSADPLFRRSLKYVGLAILFFGAGFAIFIIISSVWVSVYDFSNSYASIPTGIFLTFAAYAFYLSARSLAPLNRLSLLEPQSPLKGETSLRPSTSLGHLVKASDGQH